MNNEQDLPSSQKMDLNFEFLRKIWEKIASGFFLSNLGAQNELSFGCLQFLFGATDL